MNRTYLVATLIYIAFLIAIVTMANFGHDFWLFKFSQSFSYADKIGHLLLMGVFSFLLNSALHCKHSGFGRFRILTGSLIVYVIVITEELSQVFVDSRNADLLDMIFDAIGIYLFGVLAKAVKNSTFTYRR